MMNDYSRKLIIAVPALCLLILVIGSGSRFLAGSFSSAPARSGNPIGEPVKEIADYRNWTKVNDQPQLMQLQTAQLCAALLPPDLKNVNGPNNPHREKYISVYVNAKGREAMFEKLKPTFPEGSVIVKEKLPNKSSDTPELLTVMIKRSKGFNTVTGDWEYMVVDGGGTKVEKRGRLENCQSCHLATPGTDYIFRTYLSIDVRSKLK